MTHHTALTHPKLKQTETDGALLKLKAHRKAIEQTEKLGLGPVPRVYALMVNDIVVKSRVIVISCPVLE